MTNSDAKEIFREIVKILEPNLGMLVDDEHAEETKYKAFYDEVLPALYLLEKLKDEYLQEETLDISSGDGICNDAAVYAVISTLADLDMADILEDEDDFIDMMYDGGEIGKALYMSYYYETCPAFSEILNDLCAESF